MKVFMSYKWENDAHKEWVKKLATDLRKAGIEATLDVWGVHLGDSFTDYMTSKINEAHVVLFIITTASVKAVESQKGAVNFEMQMATARRTAGEMRLIGIYREGNKTPAHLRDHRYADFHEDSRYEEKMRELVDDLLGRDSTPPVGLGKQKKNPPGSIDRLLGGRAYHTGPPSVVRPTTTLVDSEELDVQSQFRLALLHGAVSEFEEAERNVCAKRYFTREIR